MPLTDEEIQGLLANSIDSMRHGYDHFFELARAREYHRRAGDPLLHHGKWVILSAHHAADCLLQGVLNDLDAANNCFKNPDKDKDRRHPSLSLVLKELESAANVEKLKPSEKTLLGLVRKLGCERDRIMHRALCGELDRSLPAFAMLAVRRVLRARYGVPEDHFGWTEHEILADVLDAIRANRHPEYFAYVEQALREEHPDQYIEPCPLCGTSGILNGGNHCEACFIEMVRIQCASCGNESPQPSEPMMRQKTSCPFCGGEPGRAGR